MSKESICALSMTTHLSMWSRPQALTPLSDSQSAVAFITRSATPSLGLPEALRLAHALARDAVRFEMALDEGEAALDDDPAPADRNAGEESTPERERGSAGRAQAQTLSRT